MHSPTITNAHPTPPAQIRPATRSDLTDLLSMGYELYLVEKQFEPHMTFSKQEAHDRYNRQIDDPNCLFLILEAEKKTAGYLYAHLDLVEHMDTRQPECEIEVIYIKPEFRGLGLSASLIQKAVTWAQDQKAWRVKTEIFQANIASQTTFEQQGFQNLHVTKTLDLEKE